MGAGASSAALNEERSRPRNASDCDSLESAREVVARLRSLIRECEPDWSAASASAVFEQELKRPADGSDCESLEVALGEVRRLRALLEDHAPGEESSASGQTDVHKRLATKRWEDLKTIFDVEAVDGHWGLPQFRELVVERIGEEVTDEELAQKFAAADADGDGKLNLVELSNYVFDEVAAMEGDAVVKGGLTEADLYVRIRPLAKEGGHSAEAAGGNARISIDAFDAEGVTLEEGKGSVKYNFMRNVVLPESSQKEMYKAVAAHYDEAITMQSTDVMMLAYGQTGTGKTHTMLGTKESLHCDEEHADWGIFPRFTFSVLERMKAFTCPESLAEVGGWTYLLTAKAIEFVYGNAYDLLNDHTRVQIDAQSNPVGATYHEIQKVSDLAAFIEAVDQNKTVAKTKMNANSSRSHTALILTLHQYGAKNDEYLYNSFTLFDLAGSERASKTGGKQLSGMEAAWAIEKALKEGKPVPVGAQGACINFELSSVVSDAALATSYHRQHKRYRAPKKLTSDFNIVVNGCYEGHSRLGLVICLSQSQGNSGETWFSLNMGKQLAKLRTPLKIRRVKYFPLVLKAAQKRAKKAEEDLAKTQNSSVYYARKAGTLKETKAVLDILSRLREGQEVSDDAKENFAKTASEYPEKYEAFR